MTQLYSDMRVSFISRHVNNVNKKARYKKEDPL